MKKFSFILAILLSVACFGQDTLFHSKTTTTDGYTKQTKEVTVSGGIVRKHATPSSTSADSTEKKSALSRIDHYGLYGFSYNSYSVPAGWSAIEPQFRSFGFYLNFEGTVFNVGRHVSVSSGFGFEFNNYRLSKDVIVIPDENYFSLGTEDNPSGVKKSKLVIPYLYAPFMVNVFPKKDSRSTSLGFGIVGGLRLGAHTKRKFDDGRHKEKIRDDYNLNPFKVDLMVRLDLKGFTVFAKYDPFLNLFKTEQGPQGVYPFSVGVLL